ncbi:F-box protein 40.1 isoform X1 [Scleropages formosus]|uniref:F-box protein 40.1 isoform X1 n=1 Tax=Scleropages formosus TaxID=113540 RepID=UPI00087874E7|nr:F-box only protein 40-like isoform X1 [Scleropages formosus]
MGRNNRSATKQHRHCEKCFNRYCKVPIEISVSCLIINCRLYCGAVFHMCKEVEHQLLCPNEKVPCLNVDYGCPFTMCRSKLAKHLKVCPASVVSCSMDWNRWPVEEKDTIFYDNILNDNFSEEQLDLSMALRDQKHLFSSLKMKTLFAELVEKAEKPNPSVLEGAVGGSEQANAEVDRNTLGEADCPAGEEMEGLTQEEREALAKDTSVVDMEKYRIWEKMFSMELSGCKHTVKGLGSNQRSGLSREKTASSSCETVLEEESEESQQSKSNVNVSKKSQAGEIIQNVEEKINQTGYKVCLVEHGNTVGEQHQPPAAIKPKSQTFVYGYLEPMKLKTVQTFKVPTSFRAKDGRIRNPLTTRKVTKSVDTSDLGVSLEDIPKWDEIQATLLCCLEREFRGHSISKFDSTDALLCDSGTQTYSFRSAPFKHNASLADITADRPLKLHIQIQAEGVTRRHNKASSAFTFLCNHCFRRDEFSSHFRNVHADIQSCLNGWFEQRCPLAYLGCTYSQKRFQPSTQRATVTYSQDLSTFTLKPEVSALLFEGVKTIRPERKRARNVDALSRLPFEVLVHIAGFLDSFTLSQLALVSRLMRDVCSTLLQEKGMVSLKWEKKTYSHGGSCWKSRHKVWQFSNLFSTVDRWRFDDVPSMSDHLKVCSFYHTERKSEPVALASMHNNRYIEKRTQGLVAMFGRKV